MLPLATQGKCCGHNLNLHSANGLEGACMVCTCVAFEPDTNGSFVLGPGESTDAPVPASERQVGGDHYRKFKIQPWDIIDTYDLDFYEGSALKYLLRRKTDRLEDLKKARHYLDKLIEREEAGDGAG